jgi:hypothetical protein
VVVGGSYASNQDVNTNLSENLIDDVSLEYRITKNENMYVKVFRQKNYENIIEGEITETGGGFLFRKQVGSLLDLFRKKPQPATMQPRPSSNTSQNDSTAEVSNTIADTVPSHTDSIAIPKTLNTRPEEREETTAHATDTIAPRMSNTERLCAPMRKEEEQ